MRDVDNFTSYFTLYSKMVQFTSHVSKWRSDTQENIERIMADNSKARLVEPVHSLLYRTLVTSRSWWYIPLVKRGRTKSSKAQTVRTHLEMTFLLHPQVDHFIQLAALLG